MPSNVPPIGELVAAAQHSAVHLEMRDVYTVENENESFAAWRAGFRRDPEDRASWWRPWLDLIQETVGRGVVVRRARIVSEPVSEYTRFLHDGAFTNVAAGEDVRWLPRRQTSDLALPGNDFWVFDGKLVRFGFFSGDGGLVGHALEEDPAVVKLCTSAFEAVWERAIPHKDYEIV